MTTTEYTGLLALVGAALAGAGVVAAPGIAEAVAGTVRTGICIVAGDVCRASDAAAAGLAPCTVTEHARGEGLAFTVASLRLGADEGWTAARRSDGSVLITHADSRQVGAEFGVGIEASPVALELQAEGKLDYVLGRGRAWEFPDNEAAVRFLRSSDRDAVEPTWRFGDAGAVLTGELSAGAGGVELTAVESTARAAAAVRVGRGLTTYYLRARFDALDIHLISPGTDLSASGPSTGDAIVELTRDAGGPREIAFRTVTRAGSGRLVETVARLDLRDAGNRAAAAPLLSRRLPWPPAVARDLRALVARSVRTGVVERAVYDVTDRSDGLELSAKLGLALGVDTEEVDIDRRLVAATAWTNGSPARVRADCGVTGEPRGGTS